MIRNIIIILIIVGSKSPCNGQHFSLSMGVAAGSSQIDGDKLFGFDKFMYKLWVQPVYKHNKILSTVFRLGFGNNGSKHDGVGGQTSIEDIVVSHSLYELYFMLGEQISFGGSKKRDHPHSILVGLSLNRNFNWTTKTNQNNFVATQYEVDPSSFRNQGVAFHLSYLNHINSNLSWTILLDHYVTDMLDTDFLNVSEIFPITLGAGLQINI